MNKDNIKSLALWGIVAYAVALLLYCTLTIFKQGYESISALGSLLSSTATFFAAFVAIKMYNDWRDPASYSIKKEQITEALGVISQLRYQLVCMLETILEFKKAKDFLVINDKHLYFSDSNFKKSIFEIIPNIKFFNDTNLFDEFQRMQRHHEYSEVFFRLCQKEYVKYYKTGTSHTSTLSIEIYIQPYRNYNFYQLDEDQSNFKESLLKTLSTPVGYSLLNKGSKTEKYHYESTEKLIEKTLELIDTFENNLISKLNIN